MTEEQVLSVVIRGALATLASALPLLTDEQRKILFDALTEKWCYRCGAAAPCYCAPSYDD